MYMYSFSPAILSTLLSAAILLSGVDGFGLSMSTTTTTTTTSSTSTTTSISSNHHHHRMMDRRKMMVGTIATLGSTAFITFNPLLNHQTALALDESIYTEGPQGLKYLVTEQASSEDAKKPQRAQKVKTSYTLYLNGFGEDGGKKVDTSKGLFGDKPFEFNVGTSKVIKGWDLALLDMKEGEARRLIVPASLGYGDQGAGGAIPGGATLYFEVKLTELGKMPTLNEAQIKWLEEHPLD